MASGDSDESPTSAFEVEERRLRAALYAPQASSGDLERYQRHVGVRQDAAQGESSETTSENAEIRGALAARRRKGPGLLVGAAVVVLAALLYVYVSGVGRAPSLVTDTTRHPAPASSRAVSSSRSTNAAPTAHDGGKREFATGPASVIAPGSFRYTISAGDTELGIAARFHICTSDVTAGLPLAMQGNYLAPGTAINVKLDSTDVWPDNTIHCSDD